MLKTKIVVTGALFAAIASLFQSAPILLTEAFVFLTIFSAVPIYIVSVINPKAGVLSYFAAGMIVMLLSVHEGLFFLLTNGIVGLSLGICSYYIKNKTVISFFSSIILTVSLLIMNYAIGIPVFGFVFSKSIILNAGIIFSFSIIYNVIYYYFCKFIYKLLTKWLNI